MIDEHAGYCFGVVKAIGAAEEELSRAGSLDCLGDIVHNSAEVSRLKQKGLRVIDHAAMRELPSGSKVLIRAHGEPPETYRIARENGIEIIDATCKVVLNLQQTIRRCFEEDENRQILIFGKQGHAEVIGLLGQTDGQGIVISSPDDISDIDTSRPTRLFSQTTQNIDEYRTLIHALQEKFAAAGNRHLFDFADTICHSVVNRAKQIQEFAARFDTLIFVSGEKSSNGLYLFNICKKTNPKTFFITTLEQISQLPPMEGCSIGICGATSTPMWLMEEVAARLTSESNHLKIK